MRRIEGKSREKEDAKMQNGARTNSMLRRGTGRWRIARIEGMRNMEKGREEARE